MFYSESITTSANTAEASAKRTKLKLTAGVINQVSILFPAGTNALHRLRVIHGGYQVYPTNSDGYLTGDSETVNFRDYYELMSETNTLYIETWNVDEVWDHTVYFRISVLNEWQVTPYKILSAFGDVLSSVARRLGIRT